MIANRPNSPYVQQYDLSNCDEEPIHQIRLVQSHATLFAEDLRSGRIVFAADNVEKLLGVSHPSLLGETPAAILAEATLAEVERASQEQDFNRYNPLRPQLVDSPAGKDLHLIVHEHEGMRIYEFEPRLPEVSSTDFIDQVDTATQRIQNAGDIQRVFETTVREVQRLTGHDRVMLYRFDDEGHGEVIAEQRRSDLEPFLHLRYPATDIPEPARRLFVATGTRLTADVNDHAARLQPMLHPDTGSPLDLTYGVTRGVSPVHVEYLQNMGVGATLSIAIVEDGKLWGLIACHHYSPKFIDFRLRKILRFFAKIISGHLSLQNALDFRKSVLRVNRVKTQLFEQMAGDWDILKGLTQGERTLLDLNEAEGAVIHLDGKLHRVGQSPPDTAIHTLIDWLHKHQQEPVWYTDSIRRHLPELADGNLGGVLAIPIGKVSKEYVLWFKPPQTKIVNWGGRPDKVLEENEAGNVRVSPRKSFAKWQQRVEGTSEPWARYEVDAALALRSDITDFIAQKYDEVRQLNQSLTESYGELESFSYSVSHDLRTPLRSIEGFVQILKEDYADKLDQEGRDIIETILSSTGKMQDFIHDILEFSRLGRKELRLGSVDLQRLVEEVFQKCRISPENKSRTLDLTISELPDIEGDHRMLEQLFSNLIGNAVKYSANRECSVVRVEQVSTQNGAVTIAVRDNGIGFEMKYAEKVFEVFSRLVADEEFQGTGVGLGIANRVVQRHGGRIWAESEPGTGTTFFMTLPLEQAQV